jgi:hypothetical protein
MYNLEEVDLDLSFYSLMQIETNTGLGLLAKERGKPLPKLANSL